jgi:predicted lipoprotein with Yx(FWY)xxD motif
VTRVAIALATVLLLLAGCGDDDSGEVTEPAPANPAEQVDNDEREAPKPEQPPSGTEIVVGDSEFGEMLFDAREQAIYIFENDPRGETVCYGECAAAWPPVLTNGDPQAGTGIEQSLLGTVERDDGTLQVTYADQPLYFYAHEGPGEVRCHNVNLNGGFWWVVGPDGKRLA